MANIHSHIPGHDPDTEIVEYLQIDDLASTQGDANLFVGNDPADATLSVNVPGPPGATYLDWNNLGGPADIDNHRFLDLHGPGGKDPSAFPQSNECVGATKVLSKMDLTYVASANNQDFAYFAVQRSDNNGDAGWYWLFTLQPPLEIDGQLPCKADQRRLLYDISGPNGGTGDVLVVGHFKPSATEPLVKVYQAMTSRSNVTAVNAINYTDTTLWREVVGAVAASAVNTTITDPGLFGRAGVIALTKSPPANMLLPGVFAEAAIDLDVFTGQEACGETFYGSVITRSSGSGGTSPDLKDLAGRLVFSFRQISAAAQLSPSCEQEFGYAASDENGQPLSDAEFTCQWTVKDSAGQIVGQPTGCAGTFAPEQGGTYTAAVEVMTNALNCLRTVDAGSVEVHAPIGEVAAVLAGSCQSSLDYAATVGGGAAGLGFAWSFSPEIPGPSPTDQSGTLTNVPAGTYTGTVTVTQDRADGLVCQKSATSDLATVFAPIVATATVTPSCQQEFGYSAGATGGSESYSCVWTLADGTPFSADCSGTHQPPPGSYAGNVAVTDGQTGCSDSVAFGPVNVYAELSDVTAKLVGSSNNTLSYAATASGGGGSYAFSWTFSPELTPAPTDQSGTLENVPAGTYTAEVTVADNRTDLVCQVSATSGPATVEDPTPQ